MEFSIDELVILITALQWLQNFDSDEQDFTNAELRSLELRLAEKADLVESGGVP